MPKTSKKYTNTSYSFRHSNQHLVFFFGSPLQLWLIYWPNHNSFLAFLRKVALAVGSFGASKMMQQASKLTHPLKLPPTTTDDILILVEIIPGWGKMCSNGDLYEYIYRNLEEGLAAAEEWKKVKKGYCELILLQMGRRWDLCQRALANKIAKKHLKFSNVSAGHHARIHPVTFLAALVVVLWFKERRGCLHHSNFGWETNELSRAGVIQGWQIVIPIRL